MDDRALTELPCEARHGFLWVLPTARTTLDLPGTLGPLDDQLALLDLASYAAGRRSSETHASNWKHVVESHVTDDEGALLPGRVLLPPNSILVMGEDVVSHFAVFPRAVEESVVVQTRLVR